jgi:CubicO group peptidase (beta-lactamase class C family)
MIPHAAPSPPGRCAGRFRWSAWPAWLPTFAGAQAAASHLRPIQTEAVDAIVRSRCRCGSSRGLDRGDQGRGRRRRKGYGLSDVEKSIKATEQTVYQLASVTKPFTAMAT